MHERRIPFFVYAAGAGCLIALQALLLYFLGQPLICECGYIKFWENEILSPGNSQHIADWYTFSHVIHGFMFYWLLTLALPRAPWTLRLLFVLGIEIGWEVFENTPFIIDHYREQALAQGYIGDSILNSISDTVSMMAGFLLAVRLKPRHIVFMAIAMELFTIVIVRDSLVLNILNFIAPLEFIENWQRGALRA